MAPQNPILEASRLDDLPPSARKILEYKLNHWKWMQNCFYTQDQADKLQPVKQFPAYDGAPQAKYLRHCANRIVEKQLTAIVKHRRMLMTWLGCGICTWEFTFGIEQFIAIISKKEQDSDDLVRRCKFIYENIPDEELPIKPKAQYKYCELYVPETNSRIVGFAQGADQLRQYTCSRVMCDEIAFWPQARQTFVSLKPTIQGGGKILILSTRFPGFFKELIEDTLDD